MQKKNVLADLLLQTELFKEFAKSNLLVREIYSTTVRMISQ